MADERLNKISLEILENILQNNISNLNDINNLLKTLVNQHKELFPANNYICKNALKNIHHQLINVVAFKSCPPDYQQVIPQILYQTLYLIYQADSIVKLNVPNEKVDLFNVFVTVYNVDVHYPHNINFCCMDKHFLLPSKNYSQYCLQVHIGAIKCLCSKNQLNYIVNTFEDVCVLCYSNPDITLDALKHLTECVSIITKEQWKKLSHHVFRVLMGLMTHHLPTIHEQCILLFKQCIYLEDINYLMNIIMSDISWSLRIKYYMLAEIAPVYGIKKILNTYKELPVSLWKCLNEPFLLSPCISLYKVFIKYLNEEDFSTMMILPILNLILNKNITELAKFNFVTYLLPEMKLKHLDSLLLLYKEISNEPKPDLYLQISIIKSVQAQKVNIDNLNKILNISLYSSNTKVRAEAFTILCNSKISPQVLEQIYEFINDNLNSDCSNLRNKLISGIECLLRTSKKPCDLMIQLINRIHALIINNLKCGLNYQRKITSLKMYSVILKHYRSQNFMTPKCRKLLFENLLDSDDIRRKSSELLISYFTVTLEDKELMKNWLKLGLSLCNDPVFYKNESGSIIIYTITILMYNSGLKINVFDINFRNISSYLLELAQKQVIKLKHSFVDNVINSTLYGLLNTINNLTFEKNCPKMEKLTEVEIELLLNLIDSNLKLMLDTLASKMEEEEKCIAPSFAQMEIALSSLSESKQDNKQTPTNMFLLNFIWINIKICCDVASKYAIMLADKNNYRNNHIERCANMIVNVLIMCRHKGAMEATCRSLGMLIKNWKESSSWCHHMLNDHLSSMKPVDEISRRSAGERYLIHAIVTNKKETIPYCINQLFNIAKKNVALDIYMDTIVDLPQAKALHLLTAIVSNSTITLECLYPFMEELVFLCIEQLGSPLWTVRNAALQFFSSLQVKLIGQNRLNNDSWLSHLPLEPLLYQFPQMMYRLHFLLAQTDKSLSSQSQLIPLMSLLKGVKLQSWSLLSTEHKQFVQNLRQSLSTTGFSTEIYTVRNMAAQAYVNIIQRDEQFSTLKWVGSEIKKVYQDVHSSQLCSNQVHGFTCLYKYLNNLYFLEFNQEYDVIIIPNDSMPPLCKSIYISMNRNITSPFPCKSVIGYSQVKDLMIKNDISNSSDVINLVEHYMNSDENTTINFLQCFINSQNTDEKVLIKQFIHYLELINNNKIFKLVFLNIDNLLNKNVEDSFRIDLKNAYFIKIFEKCLSHKEKDLNVMLPVLSWLCPIEVCPTLLPYVCKHIDSDIYDSFDRFNFARSLYYFTNFKDDIRLWKAVVILLQDEDSNVRTEITRFVNRLCYNQSYTLNPYFCLTKMFQLSTVQMMMCLKSAFLCFWNSMSIIEQRKNHDETINPFFNDQSNVYQEQTHIIILAFDGLKQLIYSFNDNDYFKDTISELLNKLKYDLDNFKCVFVDNNLKILDTFCFINLLKLYYKKEIIKMLNLSDYLN
ncbi:uncharacterized protein LOC126835709, partial [Adelges cooleyi]|uniref:uncharacterized protein LOC126835709 n=1 Tax=Adelges cooleyi TaxID=133065 RepID=UPI0021807934